MGDAPPCTFSLYSSLALVPAAWLHFISCIQRGPEHHRQGINQSLPHHRFLWLRRGPASEEVRRVSGTISEWLTAGIRHRWQVQTAVWQLRVRNNEWMEMRRRGGIHLSPQTAFIAQPSLAGLSPPLPSVQLFPVRAPCLNEGKKSHRMLKIRCGRAAHSAKGLEWGSRKIVEKKKKKDVIRGT